MKQTRRISCNQLLPALFCYSCNIAIRLIAFLVQLIQKLAITNSKQPKRYIDQELSDSYHRAG